MFFVPRFPLRKVCSIISALMAAWCFPAIAQSITMQVADANPLGIGDYVSGIESVDLTLGGSIKGDFDYGIKANTEYNSNFFLTDGDEESDVAVFIAPWIQYTSDPEGGALATFRANYRPTMRFYNDNSDLNNVDQNGDFILDLRGSRTNVSIFGLYSELTGTDQFTGNFVTGRVFTGGIRGGRQIAPRTSMFANLSYAKSTFDSSLDEGAQVFTGQLGGLWEYSPRLEIGSSLRYSRTESNNTGSRDAIALLGEMRYRFGERISFSASLGPEYATNSEPGSENTLNLTGRLTGSYVINELWTFGTSLVNSTVPSPTETNYLVNDLLITTMLERNLRRGQLQGGLNYRFSKYEDVGRVASNVNDEHNLSVFAGYSRPLYTDRLNMNARINYSTNSGNVDWSRVLVNIGLQADF